MDVQEQKYRKVMNEYRNPFGNILTQSPIVPPPKQASSDRNLKYITMKAVLSDNYPFYSPIYADALEDIRAALNDPSVETRVLALRLARVLPFIYRTRLIESCENELTNVVLGSQRREKDKDGGATSGSSASSGGYGYEGAADFSDLLLSVFELSSQNEDIYFDVNQRILTMFSRFFEATFQGDRNFLRNGCQVLRSIFCTFGYSKSRWEPLQNKLIAKLVSILLPSSSFVNKQDASLLNASLLTNSYSHCSNNARLFNLILRCRELQSRLRGRLLFGFCCLVGYLPQADLQISDLLSRQVLELVANVSECDVLLDCFGCLCALVSQEQPYSTRSALLKRWAAVLCQLSFKKEYFEYYIVVLDLCNECEGVPQRMSYSLAMSSIELSRHIPQQYSRFLLYNRACKIILRLSRQAYGLNPGCNFLLKIFQYDWFVDRINLQNDLFKSQFLISLLHAGHSLRCRPAAQELLDLLDLAHRLIDWKCTSKEETHIPTLKLAFDMYLFTLGWACAAMGPDAGKGVEACVEGLINRCNDPSIYFLFKFKLIARLLQLEWYQANSKYLQSAQLNFQFIQDEIRVVMMPKNPKPIFSYDYSLTFDGEIESRKQIEYIKIIMHLLGCIPKIHQSYAQEVEKIITDYHQYLNQLQLRQDANKQLINCLQTLQADYYFNEPQRYFLFACLMPAAGLGTLSYETNLEDLILYSANETVSCEDEVNIFGPMSPVQLAIRLHPHPSFTSVYIHIKKNQWVQTHNELKLVVSSGVEKKEVPFESSILQIRVDRIGALHFEVWKGTENEVLLGSGSYRIRRKLKWQRVDHLQIIDGIHTKAYFKEADNGNRAQTYLSCYYGEPILIKVAKQENEVVVGLSNKEIWTQLRDIIPSIVQELTEGAAELVQN